MIGSVVQFAAISLLLGIGSYMDIKTREIPNWISVIRFDSGNKFPFG